MKKFYRIILCMGLWGSFHAKGQSNYALDLNGTNQLADIGTPISSGSDYTKEAWIYVNSSSGAQNIISSSNTPFWLSGGYLNAGQAGNYSFVQDGDPVPLNRWVHVAVTYDATAGEMVLYRDGIIVANAGGVPGYTAENTYIGSHQGSSSFLSGSVDEVRIWSVVRTRDQLRKTMFSGPDPGNTGLLAYFKCDEGSGTTLTNATGGGNGTIVNSPSWSNSPIQADRSALHFDGNDDMAIIPNSVSSDFTIEFWMNTGMTAGSGTQWYEGAGIVDAEVGGADYDFGTSLVDDKLAFGIGDPGSDVTIMSTSAVNTGTWVHVAVTWEQSSGNMELYINGVLEATGTGSTNARTAPPRITLGQLQTDIQFFEGAIDELRIWNVLRSDVQINDNMYTELDPFAQSGLAAYYSFNQGITGGTNTGITLLQDVSGSTNNNGEIFNLNLSGNASNFVMQPAGLVPLPVSWLGFTANLQDQKTLLEWSTASEQNSLSFIVQHSIDGKNWINVGEIKAAGNSVINQKYRFIHDHPVQGVNYYRIKQVDNNGSTSISSICTVKMNVKNIASVQSNPVINNTLSVTLNEPGSLQIYSSDGRLVHQGEYAGGRVTIDLSGCKKGIYIVRSADQAERIILQ